MSFPGPLSLLLFPKALADLIFPASYCIRSLQSFAELVGRVACACVCFFTSLSLFWDHPKQAFLPTILPK